MENRIKEINEAIEAGKDALSKANKVLDCLDSAKLWGIFDMFSNRSFFSSLIKHTKLDDAQDYMEELKMALNRFNSELDDVKVFSTVDYVNFDGFTKFIDIFCDNFFVDIYAISKISDSKNHINQLINEIKNAMYKLESIK